MKFPLEIAPGLSSDDTDFAAITWADGNNVRPWHGKMETIGGWTDALSGSVLTGVCRNMLAIGKTSGGSNIVFGTHSKLQVWQGGALYDITPSGLSAGSIDSVGGTGGSGGYGRGTYSSGTYSSSSAAWYCRTWALSAYGSYTIANPRGGTIYEWQGDTGTAAAALTNAPASVTYALATPQQQILAFGCTNTSGNFDPLNIRGSDIRADTTWTPTSTNNAFEYTLDAAGGRIVAARLIGPYVAVWTNLSLWLGEYLGNPEQTYRFDRVADNCGLIGPNAVEVVDGTAYWLAPDYQFRTWTIGGPVQLVAPPIGKDFRDNVDTIQVDKICASAVSKFGEVWWHYPDSRDTSAGSNGENSRYIALSTLDGTWFRGTMARTATINGGLLQYPVKATYGGMVYYHEYGNDAAGSAIDWSLTTSDIYLGAAESWAQCKGIWPDFEAQEGDISLTITLKPYPQATARTKGPYTLAASANKKDFLVQGRVATLEFSGSSAPAFMRIGKPTLDVTITGLQ